MPKVMEQHSQCNRHPINILVSGVLVPSQVPALNQFPQTTFLFSATALAAKELALVYGTQVSVEISMNQKGELPHSDDDEPSKDLKDKSTFFRKSEFELQKIVLSYGVSKCSRKENLNVNMEI